MRRKQNWREWPSIKAQQDRKRIGKGERRRAFREIEVRSQVEVASILGISHQAVQQIERNAIWKIRRSISGIWKELIA